MTKSWTDERLEERFDQIDQRFDGMDRRFDGMDRRFGEVDRRLDVVDQRLDGIDQRLDRVETDIRELRAEMKAGFDLINERFDGMYRLIVRGGLVLIAALLGVIATFAAVFATQL